METVATIVGNDDDGWNVEATIQGTWWIELACEDREHAEELRESLERCSWFAMREIRP